MNHPAPEQDQNIRADGRRPCRKRQAGIGAAIAIAIGVAVAVNVALAAKADACLSDEVVAQWVDHYEARTPVPNPPLNMSKADAACTRAKLQAELAARLGRPVGYKAGLTNPAVQKRFNTDEPVWGRLYQGNLMRSGAMIDARFGSRPLFEADLLVRVASLEINQARTPEDVLAAVDQIIPFMELPDLLVENPSKLNAAGVTAINVGARLGVVGNPIVVPGDAGARQRLLDELRDMRVVLKDKDGKELSRGKGSDVLGQPLNAIIWLAGALADHEEALKPGDLVSLGSFSALLPPSAGQTVTLEYEGLSGARPVKVSFK